MRFWRRFLSIFHFLTQDSLLQGHLGTQGSHLNKLGRGSLGNATWTNISNGIATPQGENCAKLFWNPCINVRVMAQTSSIYVTFQCDLDLQPTCKNVSNGASPSQGQQLCQLFWNPRTNVEVMARTHPSWCKLTCVHSLMHAPTYTEQKL